MKEIKVKRDCTNIKKPKILPSNKIEIFAARKLRFKAAEYQKKQYWSCDCFTRKGPSKDITGR